MFFLWNRHYFVKTKTDLQVEAEKKPIQTHKTIHNYYRKGKSCLEKCRQKKNKNKMRKLGRTTKNPLK